mgnify:CR=1 FL=1
MLQLFKSLPEEEKKYWHSREPPSRIVCGGSLLADLESVRRLVRLFQFLTSSHASADKYEVESGQLVLRSKDWVPLAAEDLAEQPTMQELHTTYGKVRPSSSIATPYAQPRPTS